MKNDDIDAWKQATHGCKKYDDNNNQKVSIASNKEIHKVQIDRATADNCESLGAKFKKAQESKQALSMISPIYTWTYPYHGEVREWGSMKKK